MGSAYRDILYEIVTPIMAAFVIVLNLLEIVFIWKTKKIKTMGTIYIINLSISDVVVGVLMVGLKIITPFMRTSLKNNATAKEAYNIVRYCFIRLSLFVSVFNLISLTLDWLWAISKPFGHRQKSSKFAVKICVGVWVLSTVSVTGVYSWSRFYKHNTERYANLVFPIATYTAAVTFVICYSIIYRALKKSKIIRNTIVRRSGTKDLNSKTKHGRTEAFRFLKLAVKTISIFMICWLPYSTCSLFKAIGVSCGGMDIQFTLFTLAFFNSILNPFIYFSHVRQLLSVKMRALFRKI